MTYIIESNTCIACGTCESVCPVGSPILIGTTYQISESCIGCGSCSSVCPVDAISSGEICVGQNGLIKSAVRMIGIKYLLGGDNENGIDNSHFVHLIYKINGKDYPYSSSRFFHKNTFFKEVTKPNLGDVVFVNNQLLILVNINGAVNNYIGVTINKGVGFISKKDVLGVYRYYEFIGDSNV